MSAGVSQTGGHRASTLGGCTPSLTCTGTQGKAITPQEPGLHLLAGLGGSPRKVGIGCGSLWGQGLWWQKPQGLSLSVISLEDCHFGTKTWPHSTRYGSRAGLPQVKQQQGGHTAISIHGHMVHNCSRPTEAKLSDCNRHPVTCKASVTYCLALYRKSLLTPVLEKTGSWI